MLAPNGRPTNLNERQWLQTRTKNFLNWFGDWINDPSNASKIVDENGEPLVVYHNTDNNFTKFSKFRSLIGKLTGSALFGRGFYFSNYQGSSHRINMPVFLSVKNPAEGVMESGNDGMIQDFGNGQVWYAAKKPNQIKSATDNIGTFSQENDDIQMMVENNQIFSSEKFDKDGKDIVSLQAEQIVNNIIQQLENNKHIDDTAVDLFNEIINKIQNGELKIKNTDGKILGQNRFATILTTLSRFGYERYRTSGRSGQMEKALNLVRKYLKETGEWQEQIETIVEEKCGKPSPKSGIESQVYFIGDSAIKLQSLSVAKLDLAKAVERILLQNEFDPSCKIDIIGAGQTQQGEFKLLLKQRHIKDAVEATAKEIEADMEKRGFDFKGMGDYGPIYEHRETNLKIEDVASRNVLKTKDGNLHYVDVIISRPENYAMEDENDDFQFMAEENNSQPTQPAQKPLTPKAQTVKRLLKWRAWQKQHIAFDEKTHTYYLDGKPVDYSVTQYQEEVYGKPNIRGDYKFAQQMGNAVDKLTRDFFNYIFNKGESPLNKNYQNLSETKKMEIIGHLKRLREQFDKEFTNPATGKPSTREALFFVASPLVFVTIIGT